MNEIQTLKEDNSRLEELLFNVIKRVLKNNEEKKLKYLLN